MVCWYGTQFVKVWWRYNNSDKTEDWSSTKNITGLTGMIQMIFAFSDFPCHKTCKRHVSRVAFDEPMIKYVQNKPSLIIRGV